MRGRSSFAYALLLSAIAGATTWAALLSWRGFTVTTGRYLAPLLVLAVVVAGTGAVLRWIGSPAVVTLAVQTLLAVALLSNEIGGNPLPVGATYDQVILALDRALDSAQVYAAPIPADVPTVVPLLLVGGAFFVVVVDFLACSLRRVPIAGLALLAIYSVPAGLTESGPGIVAFVLAAVGYLAMLHLDSREHLLKWGRPLGPDSSSPWTDDNPVLDAMRVGAGRIGTAAMACAIVLPPFVPLLDLDVFGIGPGDGDTNIEIRNPRTDLRGDLEREADVPLIRFRTDDPSPSYLRVAVLNRFTGVEWSSGDRGVSDDNTSTGQVPLPQGLSDAVPRTPYDYDFEAFDNFESTWLPTPYPATSVVADGDWRYDEDTMDFIAVPDDLTTQGLDWQASGLDLDYGTTGEYFRDSGIDAVEDEFLDVPGGLPSIVRSEAVNATRGAISDYEAALLLQDYFRASGGFRYDLDEAPTGIGGEAFSTFLDDSDDKGRVGYCEQFASAMAVMARMVGIPARVAVGFLEPQPLGNGEWEYSSHDLHAWPELYFEGTGWVRFEPTPSLRAEEAPDYSTVPVDREPETEPTSNPSTSTPTRRPPDDQNEPTRTAAPEEDLTSEDGSADDGIDWTTVLVRVGTGLLVLLVLLLVATTPRTLRRRARDRRLAGGPEELWDELRATATDLAVPWPDGRTPQEIGRVLVEHLGERGATDRPERPRTGPDADPEAASALERAVVAIEHARYARPGTTTPPPGLAEDVRICCASLEAGVTRRIGLRARWLPPSLTRRGRTNADQEDLVGV
ncbi:transglutaminase family protein [Nocardioides stalactiti]|uniref:transglutaminase family protein n=1 Tax=Nocardioides stalactiti TaxID=2755356 RepID=UPI0016028DCF|nr:DUF3488 and transglutaminase-like domain-containing protein [Nocardioides stalactiti]